MGKYCVLEEDVEIGKNFEIGHHCVLKNGTRIGDNVTLGDYCKTTGLCYIGNNVNVRTDSCISKGVIVEDKAFIGGGVMTSHTRNIHHCRPKMEKCQYITHIGYGAIIGSGTNLSAGVKIGDNVIVGYGSNVLHDLVLQGVYFGNPARFQLNLLPEDFIEIPKDYIYHEFTEEELKRYLPFVR